MKRIGFLFISVLFFICMKLYSQTYYGVASYKVKLAEDFFRFYDSKLYFNDTQSKFISKNDINWDWQAGEDNPDRFVLSDTIGHLVVRDLTKPFLMVRDFCLRNQPKIYADTLKIDWKITTINKKIQGLDCTMATTKFRGRNYTAWFTGKIPIPFGPWKFGGLPGLIVEIIDDTQEVSAQLKSIAFDKAIQSTNDMKGEHISRVGFFECKDKKWVEDGEKLEAIFAEMRAEGLEATLEQPERRPATELEFNQ